MTTKLQSSFKRELDLNGDKYTLTVSPEGFKLVPKGKRKGIELHWSAVVSGEAALATALNASLAPSRPSFDAMSGSTGRSHTKH
jgi:hypothetical protein